MSAEGILADPGLFYRRGVSLCPFTQKKNPGSQEIEKKIFDSSNEKFQAETKFCERNKNSFLQHKSDENSFSKYENSLDLANENEIKVNTESEIEIDSKVRNTEEMEWNGQIHGTPDRATLFSEYCFLSGMFFDAGGWTCLEMKDNLFEKGDSNDKNLNTTCSCGSGDSSCNNGRCSICFDPGNDASYDEHHKEYPPSSSSSSSSIPTPISIPTPTNICMQSKGEEKQIETARQHLFWMLEKKGHGRTVRFVHLGDYRRHTDLLTDVKNSNSLLEMNLIARTCLKNVFGSNVYNNENYY